MKTVLDTTNTGKQNQVGRLEQTSDGSWTLVHPVHGETYHSSIGALREATQLYIGSSGIKPHLSSEINLAVLDVGLGLGYNALATIEEWVSAKSPGHLTLISLESNLELVRQFASLEGEWQSEWNLAWRGYPAILTKNTENQWSAKLRHSSCSSILNWEVFAGDALDFRWLSWCRSQGITFDYVWQDAFSPKVCPELWTTDWFSALRSIASSGSKLLTYSVARGVRDHLEGAGWSHQRIPGTGSKKHWLIAINTNGSAIG